MQCCSYLSRRKCASPPKRGCLLMRVWNKDWLEVVLFHVTVAEWKESFIMTGHAFIQNFTQNEEPLIPRVIRNYAISASLHMRRSFSFGFQSDRGFTCTLNQIRNGINYPLRTDQNLIPIKLNRIDYGVHVKPFQSDWASLRLQTEYLVACKRSHWRLE